MSEHIGADSSCSCPFNKTASAVKDRGRGKGQRTHDGDAQACIQTCKDTFLKSISPNYSENFGDVCALLSSKGPNEKLWSLYWCDSTFCGVWVNQSAGVGQDRKKQFRRYSLFPLPADHEAQPTST